MKRIFKKALTYIVLALLIASIILGSISIGLVTSSTYKYYKSCYKEASGDYAMCLVMANNASNIFLKLAYEELADEYRVVMNRWRNKVEDIEDKSATCGIISAVLFVVAAAGAVLVIVKTKKEIALENAAVAANEAIEGETTEAPEAIPEAVDAPAVEESVAQEPASEV